MSLTPFQVTHLVAALVAGEVHARESDPPRALCGRDPGAPVLTEDDPARGLAEGFEVARARGGRVLQLIVIEVLVGDGEEEIDPAAAESNDRVQGHREVGGGGVVIREVGTVGPPRGEQVAIAGDHVASCIRCRRTEGVFWKPRCRSIAERRVGSRFDGFQIDIGPVDLDGTPVVVKRYQTADGLWTTGRSTIALVDPVWRSRTME